MRRRIEGTKRAYGGPETRCRCRFSRTCRGTAGTWPETSRPRWGRVRRGPIESEPALGEQIDASRHRWFIGDRAIRFATNALVVTYSPESAHASDLARDWQTAIGADGVRIGRTAPAVDPLGYRTVVALRLAERRYDVDAQRVLGDSRISPETDVLNVVEGGAIDAAFTYRSMAVERDMSFVPLPDAIDFSDLDRADVYAGVSYDLEHATVRGVPISYAATATTSRGEWWVEALVAAWEQLQANGFAVPSNYPVYDERLEFPSRGELASLVSRSRS